MARPVIMKNIKFETYSYGLQSSQFPSLDDSKKKIFKPQSLYSKFAGYSSNLDFHVIFHVI